MLAYGCSHNEDKFKNNLYYANNFESIDGWCGNPLIFRCSAHSGKYACRIDKDHVYSMGFEGSIKEISGKGLKKINVNAWIKVENSGAWAKVVVEARNAQDSIISWNAVITKDFNMKTGEWFPVSGSFDLPDSILDGKIKVYIFNQTPDVLFADDLGILFEEKN